MNNKNSEEPQATNRLLCHSKAKPKNLFVIVDRFFVALLLRMTIRLNYSLLIIH